MLAHPLLVLVQEEFYSPTSHLPLRVPMNNWPTTADHIPAGRASQEGVNDMLLT